MIEIQRILCPIDFSDHSRRALDHAMAIARWYKSTVTVLHVFSPAPLAGFGPTSAFAPVVLTPADFEQLLADTKAFAETERAPGVAIAALVREGHTAGAILEQAIGMAADLLVIGTHGRFGLERLLLGSVAEKVLRRARCPVMTVPTQSPDAVPAGPVLYRRILCPVDFSDASSNALAYAISMAQEANGQLTVLHVAAHEFEYDARHRVRQGHEHWRLPETTRAGARPASSRSRSRRARVLPRGVVDDAWKALARSAAHRRSTTE